MIYNSTLWCNLVYIARLWPFFSSEYDIHKLLTKASHFEKMIPKHAFNRKWF